MKATVLKIILLMFAITAMARIIIPFKDWQTLIQNSPDIVIARGVTDPDGNMGLNGINVSDIQVLSVLKGDTMPGQAKIASEYCPRKGERFLMFSRFWRDDHSQFY